MMLVAEGRQISLKLVEMWTFKGKNWGTCQWNLSYCLGGRKERRDSSLTKKKQEWNIPRERKSSMIHFYQTLLNIYLGIIQHLYFQTCFSASVSSLKKRYHYLLTFPRQKSVPFLPFYHLQHSLWKVTFYSSNDLSRPRCCVYMLTVPQCWWR